jgi:coenzyme F420 hydrogenase subunit beta
MVEDEAGSLVPRLDEARCIHCGLCLAVCPMVQPISQRDYAVRGDLAGLTGQVFGAPAEDPLLGHYRSLYLAHATNAALRHRASSGGVTTALLQYALASGLADGALVVRADPEAPLRPYPAIVTAADEIAAAAGSRYCPVPLNTAIAAAHRFDGRLAVAGLPCHIQGLRRAALRLPWLAERITLHLALFCYHGVTLAGTRFWLDRLGIPPQDVATLDYRGRGWPGRMAVTQRNGAVREVPYHTLWRQGFGFFSPLGCLPCRDAAGELGDISLGDAWLPRLRSEYGRNPGENLAIVRSAAGEALWRAATEAGAIDAQSATRAEVLTALHLPLRRKKLYYGARLRAMQRAGLATPAPEPDAEAAELGRAGWRAVLHSRLELSFLRAIGRPAGYGRALRAPAFVLRGVTLLSTFLEESPRHLLGMLRGR